MEGVLRLVYKVPGLLKSINVNSLPLNRRLLCSHLNHKPHGPAAFKEIQQSHKEALRKELEVAQNFTSEEWNALAKKLIKCEKPVAGSIVNPRNVDGVILRFCAEFGLNDVGIAYFQHMKKKNIPLNGSILSRYLSLCSFNKKFAMENESELLAVYKQLCKSDVMEPTIAERCISLICLFEKHWKDAFVLLEKVKVIANPSPSSYCPIIEACFTFGDVPKGWEVMRSLVQTSQTKPRPQCYIAYIEHCQRRFESGDFKVELVEDLFQFLEEFHLSIPNLEVVQKLEKLIFSLADAKFEWSLKETYVPKNACCCNCNRVLEPVKISSSEFQDLCKHFVKKAVVGSNVFLKSTPVEIEKFKSFLVRAQPYDVVIDGLNVAYGRGNKGPYTLATTLKSVVYGFVRKNKKILVLGRKHMKNWPAEPMAYVYENAKVFLAMNLSEDDPLLLYAALKGGEKTSFVSRDFMRSHLFALEDPRMKLLFRKWLISHQNLLSFFSTEGRPVILPPLSYLPTAQKLPLKEPELCWHVPYDEQYLELAPEKREPSPKWLCIRRVPRKS